MTLALIAMAGLVLVGLARYSLSISAEVARARNDVQGRWGTRTLSQCILPRAEEICELATQVEGPARSQQTPAGPLLSTVRLGEMDFRIVLDDESRKVNVNRLYVAGGTEEVYEALKELGISTHLLSLAPSPGRVGNSRYQPFDSWGQVFALDKVPLEEPVAPWLQSTTGDVTCWGDGRIHYARASERAPLVAARAAGPITATQLVAIRHRNPQLNLSEHLMSLIRVTRPRRD